MSFLVGVARSVRTEETVGSDMEYSGRPGVLDGVLQRALINQRRHAQLLGYPLTFLPRATQALEASYIGGHRDSSSTQIEVRVGCDERRFGLYGGVGIEAQHVTPATEVAYLVFIDQALTIACRKRLER